MLLRQGGAENLSADEIRDRKANRIGRGPLYKAFSGLLRSPIRRAVSSGLLELNIVTEDIPETELLHILKSSRTRKKYYSLKIGAFVDLEDFLPKIPP